MAAPLVDFKTLGADQLAKAARPRLTFWRRHGYRVVGLLPDVNGPGRPDILLAKRLA